LCLCQSPLASTMAQEWAQTNAYSVAYTACLDRSSWDHRLHLPAHRHVAPLALTDLPVLVMNGDLDSCRGGTFVGKSWPDVHLRLRGTRWVRNAAVWGRGTWQRATGAVHARLTVRSRDGRVMRLTLFWNDNRPLRHRPYRGVQPRHPAASGALRRGDTHPFPEGVTSTRSWRIVRPISWRQRAE
jgi:hypothetical protein